MLVEGKAAVEGGLTTRPRRFWWGVGECAGDLEHTPCRRPCCP